MLAHLKRVETRSWLLLLCMKMKQINSIKSLPAQYISDPDMLAAKLVEQVLKKIPLTALMMMPNYPGIPPISRPSQKCQKTWKVCQSVRALQWSFKREICQEHLHLPLPSSDPGPPRHDARVREYLQDSLLRAVPRYDRAETLCTRGGGRYKLFWLKTYQGRLKNAFFTVNLTRVDQLTTAVPTKECFYAFPITLA